jgi:hypothetical protein
MVEINQKVVHWLGQRLSYQVSMLDRLASLHDLHDLGLRTRRLPVCTCQIHGSIHADIAEQSGEWNGKKRCSLEEKKRAILTRKVNF